MKIRPPRVYYVPNEHPQVAQLGCRRAFDDLLNAGLIQEVQIRSLQLEILESGESEDHRQRVIAEVASMQPDIILLQHATRMGLRREHFDSLRRRSPGTKIIYHEGDPYSRWLHPLPASTRHAGAAADVVYTVGSGTFRENFIRAGARDVRWEPSVFEPDRYPAVGRPGIHAKKHDVVMIANRNRPRLRGLPNWRDRIRFVETMQAHFGTRFAVFGRGWEGDSAVGPVDFNEQHWAIRQGWVSANWDHFAAEPHYFSNRLPISLSQGSVHATTCHPGYEELFPQAGRFLFVGRTFDSLIEQIEKFLAETSPGERLALGEEAARFAHRYYRQDDQIVRFLNSFEPRIIPEAAREVWTV